jgi:hypothetical protein
LYPALVARGLVSSVPGAARTAPPEASAGAALEVVVVVVEVAVEEDFDFLADAEVDANSVVLAIAIKIIVESLLCCMVVSLQLNINILDQIISLFKPGLKS